VCESSTCQTFARSPSALLTSETSAAPPPAAVPFAPSSASVLYPGTSSSVLSPTAPVNPSLGGLSGLGGGAVRRPGSSLVQSQPYNQPAFGAAVEVSAAVPGTQQLQPQPQPMAPPPVAAPVVNANTNPHVMYQAPPPQAQLQPAPQPPAQPVQAATPLPPPVAAAPVAATAGTPQRVRIQQPPRLFLSTRITHACMCFSHTSNLMFCLIPGQKICGCVDFFLC
jgi:hypothetical protein